jgi:protein-S-isoprenylcysteine O-methyltransferase Ste14
VLDQTKSIDPWTQRILALAFVLIVIATVVLLLSKDEWARWTAFVLALVAAIGHIIAGMSIRSGAHRSAR